MKNIREEINKELAAIETLAKIARVEYVIETSHGFDSVAREIKSHADRIKDLSYELGLQLAVRS